MKSSKFFRICIGIIVAIFIINQLISSLYIPIKTESAIFYTANDGFEITGQIIRGETLVTSSAEGVLHFTLSDGTRVAKNGVIANIYSSANASVTVSRMDVLHSQISDIEDILSYNDIEAANLELINAKIKDSLDNLIFSGANGSYSEMEELTDNLLSAGNRKQMALGDDSGLSQRLESLKAELLELTATLPAVQGSVMADRSGYFVSKTDGYEGVLKADDLSQLTPEAMQNVRPQEVGENVIGKIVSDYEWYVAAVVSINDSLNYKEGDTLKLETSVKSAPTLTATVKKINISETLEKAVIVFACNDMNSELASIRTANMTVVTKEYTGLRISRKALRVVDGVKGVYVQTGMQVSFVPVEIIYRSDSYIICEKVNENGNYLKLYDKVVVKGKNLYDGKIVG